MIDTQCDGVLASLHGRSAGGKLRVAPAKTSPASSQDGADQSSDHGRAGAIASLKLAYAGSLSAERTSDKLRDLRRRFSGARQWRDQHLGARRAGRRRTHRRSRRDSLPRWAFRARAFSSASRIRPRSEIMVDIGYIAYAAHTDACGDWSVNAARHLRKPADAEFRLRRPAEHRRPGRRSARPHRSAQPGPADATAAHDGAQQIRAGARPTVSAQDQRSVGRRVDVNNGQ